MTQPLRHIYSVATARKDIITILPAHDAAYFPCQGFLRFHKPFSEKPGSFVKPVTEGTFRQSDYFAVMKNDVGEVIAQCLLVACHNKARQDLDYYPAAKPGEKILIITSLTSTGGGAKELIEHIGAFAQKLGYTHLLAKANEQNTSGISLFSKAGFTNGTTYTAHKEAYAAHYFYKSLTDSPDCGAAPTPLPPVIV